MDELIVSKLDMGIFVEPHFIEELGRDGLTAEEVARSLDIHVDAVRRKLRERPDEMLISLGCMDSRMVNINGVEYFEFLLSTAAAKFFVARYENAVGRAYLAYLLGAEVAFEKLIKTLKTLNLRPSDLEELAKKGTHHLLENTQLKKERELQHKIDHEPVTDDEYALLQRLMNSRLRVFGRTKPKHRRDFHAEILEKFCYPVPDEAGVYFKLQRKNWLAALQHVTKRTWSIIDE